MIGYMNRITKKLGGINLEARGRAALDILDLSKVTVLGAGKPRFPEEFTIASIIGFDMAILPWLGIEP
jgi:hypothetical protein